MRSSCRDKLKPADRSRRYSKPDANHHLRVDYLVAYARAMAIGDRLLSPNLAPRAETPIGPDRAGK